MGALPERTPRGAPHPDLSLGTRLEERLSKFRVGNITPYKHILVNRMNYYD
jgi:hypothetical protein